MEMNWIHTLTIIGSILIPTISGFAWIIHRMDAKFDRMDAKFEERFNKVDIRINSIDNRINNIENKLTALDMRTSFIERLLEMIGTPLKNFKERTDP